jgi:phosphoribosylanthranilate isomerase
MVQLLNLDMIQLHGDEPPGMLPAFPPRSILRAFRCGDNGFVAIEEYLEHCKGLRLPDAILLDGCKPGEYGGTGRVIDWQALADNRHRFPGLPLVLAGGLTPFNVADAIGAVRPDAVDTASGVETEQGQKDPMLVRAFVTSSKRAFAAMKTA